MEKNIVYGWVSRDKKGKLQLHSHKPIKMRWFGEYLRGLATLPPDQFPEVTWDTGPKEISIEMKLL